MVKKLDDSFFEIYVDVKIEYPFCYVTPNKKNYFRYLADGRYEYICFENNRVTLSFGARAQSINGLLSDDEVYFKILANINTVITNEEFELRRSLLTVEYNKYLDGDKYIAAEVQKSLMKNSTGSVVEKVVDSNDIVTRNDEPF